MIRYVYLNNKYINFKDAHIHIEDRGFQFSDSVYEVVKVINKKILDFDFHI
jgi:Branched-chain amino acid aminotransferase/4-amino-4-deoxychorismate lyase